jgi:phospholipid-binding lipoprotein MlaA
MDVTANPLLWIGQGAAVNALEWSRVTVSGVDTRDWADNLIETTKQTAVDPYTTFRNLYQQARRAQAETIRDDRRATIPVWFPQGSANSSGR